MSVYVDKSRNKYRGMIMCHMMSDTPQELHEMALRIGMKTIWFQPYSSPHYDVCLMRRKKALEYGAIEIDRRETVRLIHKIRANPELNWLPQKPQILGVETLSFSFSR